MDHWYRNSRALLWTVAILSCATTVHEHASSSEPSTTPLEHFEEHIRPLLVTRCLKCHGEKKQQGELRLDTRAALLTGGESGAAIVPGDPSESLLISAVSYDALEMPPDGQLSAREIEALRLWIRNGASWPANTTLQIAKPANKTITVDDRQHWSFQPINNPAIPVTEGDNWSRNPIDRFVYRRMQNHGVTPAPTADRRTLIRRLCFDLLGLPPTPQQIITFLADESPTAYAALVDRLLSQPAFGERWARHWLDLVRYAESDGYRADAYRPNAWRYRDYVIAAFNNDKPYDQFIREQLAGDELYPDNPAAWVATAYLRLPLYEYNQRDVVTQRHDILNDITDVTADVFLGLGMKCARCHDHKFDPLLQTDYFQLQSYFAAILPRDKVPLATGDQLAAYQMQSQAWVEATKDIRAQIAAIRRPYQDKQANAALAKFPPEKRAILDTTPDQRTPFEQQIAYFIERQTREEGSATPSKTDQAKIDELEKELAKFAHLKPPPLPTIEVVTDTMTPPATHIPGRDETTIRPAAIEVLCHAAPAMDPVATGRTTGRRAALANWLTSPTHPLTARVAVNRMWQHHFGRGLVETPSDFGRLGKAPTHPQLLDWLARRFIDDGWSWKSVHRLIVMSETYRQSAHHPLAPEMEQIDPENRLRWRWDTRRLAAEQIFDALLSVSGQLDVTVGGASANHDSHRRAIYRKMLRNKSDDRLSLFDMADGINSVANRPTTTTATQALALLNTSWASEMATAMSERVTADTGGDLAGTIQTAYELAVGRPPDEYEMQLAKEFIAHQDIDIEELNAESYVDFCHVLLNSNEFIYID